MPRLIYVARQLRSHFLRKKQKWRCWTNKPTARNKRRFFAASKILFKQIKKFTSQHEISILKKSSDAFYRHFTSSLNPSSHQIILKDSNSQPVTVNNKICELYAIEFLENFSAPLPINVTVGLTEQSNFQMSITITYVRAALHEMPNSAAGPDGIPAVVYKRMAHLLDAPLFHIYHKSLRQGILTIA